MVESVGNSIDAEPAADQAVQRQGAGKVKARDFLDVNLGDARAVIAAHNAFALIGEIERVDLDSNPVSRHTHQNGASARGDHAGQRFDGLRSANSFEGVIGAARGCGEHRLHRVPLVGPNKGCCTECGGGFELLVGNVDGDDRIRSNQMEPGDDRKPHTAASDYCRFLTRADARRIDYRAHTSGHSTPQKCANVEREFFRHCDCCGFRHNYAACEGAQAQIRPDFFTVVVPKRRSAVGELIRECGSSSAEPPAPCYAIGTSATRGEP